MKWCLSHLNYASPKHQKSNLSEFKKRLQKKPTKQFVSYPSNRKKPIIYDVHLRLNNKKRDLTLAGTISSIPFTNQLVGFLTF